MIRFLFQTRGPWLPRLWVLAWSLLAILHVTQGIWLSGWSALPADLADGRFNAAVLEHGYLVLHGEYAWASPGQFFPAQHTLGFSDTHAGTLPLYATARFFGAAPEPAFQLWLIAVVTLNVVAGLRLLRALAIPPWLAGPLMFAACAPATLVWYAGTHVQVLPVFPALFALDQLVRWFGDRKKLRLVATGGWFAWQFAASPYVAFFAATLGGLVLVLRLTVGRSAPDALKSSATPARAMPIGAMAIAVTGVVLALAAATVYVRSLSSGHGRMMHEVVHGAPTWRAWFTAPPAHAWYPAGWPAHGADLTEGALFAGFLPWLLATLALVEGWKRRRTAAGAWSFAFAGAALAGALVFTRWNDAGSGGFLFLAQHIEPLRAFRASGRAIVIVQPLLVFAVGLGVARWWQRRDRAWSFGLSVLIALETIGAHQPVTSIAVARARVDAVIEQWHASGDRRVLVFAPGQTDQHESILHMDAWCAALRQHRVTMNGYSGGAPRTHLAFLWNPTVENARALVGATGMAESDVSLVEDWGAAAEAALGIARLPSRMVSRLQEFDLQPVRWTLFAPLETWVLAGATCYQFTPPAEVQFPLPDGATQVEVWIGFREGAYTEMGHSDGVGVGWFVAHASGGESQLWRQHVNPRDRPEHRGLFKVEFNVPVETGRQLILRVDHGPAGDGAWDWPVFARLRAH